MTAYRLPLLAPHDSALQKCVYCPKLSRASCPVSNVEASETLTPWGKMSLAYFAARGDVPIDEVHAESAWACSGCYACRERCDHRNEVATVLYDARADYFAKGVAPAAAVKVVDGFREHLAETRQAAERLDSAAAAGGTSLLIGCSYLRHHPADQADKIHSVAERFNIGPLRVARGCCAAPLHQAGDRAGFVRAARAFADELSTCDAVVAVDPGCARTLQQVYPVFDIKLPRVELLIDRIAADIDKIPALALESEKLRYHDPCQLGRGLGRFEEPRAILARLTGKSPDEFVRSRHQGECSGAGGLLPLTRPAASQAIADERVSEHRDAGGGRIVSGCGESLRRFRSRGAEVVDLYALVAEAFARS